MRSAGRIRIGSLARSVATDHDQAPMPRLADLGKIPFDFRIAVMENRHLGDPAALASVVREALRLLRGLLPEHAGSGAVLVVVSCACRAGSGP